MRPQRGDLGGHRPAQPPCPVLWQQQDVGDVGERGGEGPLLPIELGAQAHAQGQHWRTRRRERIELGRQGRGRRIGARMLVVQGRQGRLLTGHQHSGGAVRHRHDALDRRQAGKLAQCRHGPAPHPIEVEVRIGRPRPDGAGPRSLRQHLAGIVEQDGLGVGLADVEDDDGHGRDPQNARDARSGRSP